MWFNDTFFYLTLQAPTPQNGQTHSNNSSAKAEIVWVCLTILWGWRLKAYIPKLKRKFDPYKKATKRPTNCFRLPDWLSSVSCLVRLGCLLCELCKLPSIKRQGFYIKQTHNTQKMKFSIKYFFSKYDQIRSSLRIWSHLLKKSFIENFIFCAVSMFIHQSLIHMA